MLAPLFYRETQDKQKQMFWILFLIHTQLSRVFHKKIESSTGHCHTEILL